MAVTGCMILNPGDLVLLAVVLGVAAGCAACVVTSLVRR